MQSRLYHRPSARLRRVSAQPFHGHELPLQLAKAAQAQVIVAGTCSGEFVAGGAQFLPAPQALFGALWRRRIPGYAQLAVAVQDAGHFVHGVE